MFALSVSVNSSHEPLIQLRNIITNYDSGEIRDFINHLNVCLKVKSMCINYLVNNSSEKDANLALHAD